MTLSTWRAGGETFAHEVDGRRRAIFWRRGGSGDGPTLLCIHGFPTASYDWRRVWLRLCARFGTVIAPDLLGFGFSDKPRDHAYTIAGQADLLEALLAHLAARRVHVLAHDYGDTVAQELLARHEDRGAGRALELASVCFLNGGLFPETHRPRPMQRLLASPAGPLVARLIDRRRFGRAFRAVFGARTQPSEAELDDCWALYAGSGGVALTPKLIGYMRERRAHRARWVGALERTSVPLRVVDGAADPISGAEMVTRYRSLVPRPDCVLLPGIGHYPQLEAPSEVLEAFFAFHDRIGNREQGTGNGQQGMGGTEQL